MLGIIVTWGSWSETVNLPDIISGSITFEKILELLVILVGSKIKGY